jgi:hypothetical protein
MTDSPVARTPRMSRPERERLAAELKDRYTAGASVRDLVEDTGRSYGGIRSLLVLAGVRFRSRGGANNLPHEPW